MFFEGNKMRKIIIHINYLFLLAILLFVTSCEHEVLISEDPEEIVDDKVRIEIFTRADSYKLPVTKGLNDENTVGITPWILVFKGNDEASATFVEAVQAFELIGKRYVLLTRQRSGTKYHLLILANPQSEFYYGDADSGYEFKTESFTANLKIGVTTLSEACSNLLTEPLAIPSQSVVPYSGEGETIPMSYLLEVDEINNSTKIENTDGSSLLLSRIVSKIAIVNAASNFDFTGITAIVNVPRQGQLHKSDGAVYNTSGLTELRYDAGYSSPLIATSAVSGGQSTADKPIYLYESPVSNNTYFIIQGTYEGYNYFYKMAIVDDNQTLMSLERNKLYTFTINKVHGPGFDTVADAKVSKPSNTALDYSVLVDDSNTYEIIANNDYYLGVSNSVFFAYTNETAEYEAFRIITDCKTIFPNSNKISDERSLADYAYRLVSPFGISIAGAGSSDPNVTPVNVEVKNYLQFYDEFQFNQEGTALRQNAYITLKLGNLEKQIHINQRKAINAGGETIQYMPTTNRDPQYRKVNYTCLSGYVEDNAVYSPKNWIKLRPSSGEERNDTDNITVDDGAIFIEVLPNPGTDTRNGIVYLTTIDNNSSSGMATQRIKIDITQLGNSISVN